MPGVAAASENQARLFLPNRQTMNSCLYRCNVMHHRLSPKENKFTYSIFMFYVDLDEIETLASRLLFLSYNKFNWFNFRDADHLQYPAGKRNTQSVKENIIGYLHANGIDLPGGRVMLLTNVATLGYSFNPVSFYLCFDNENNPRCAIAEVCNTHNEMKLFLLDESCLEQDTFRLPVTKHFYVSPFADLETKFDFILRLPGDTLLMRVDDYKNDQRVLLSALSGRRRKLHDGNLLWYGIRFPFITLKIITLIHWQAFKLYLKGIPYWKKNINIHLQKDTINLKKI